MHSLHPTYIANKLGAIVANGTRMRYVAYENSIGCLDFIECKLILSW